MNTNLPISQLDPLGAGVFTGVGSLMEQYLGEMPVLQRSDPYEKQNIGMWTMPKAFLGQNLYLGQWIEDLQFTVYNGVLTQAIFPIQYTEQITVTWELFEANAHLMELTPYLTTSHMVSQKMSIRRAQLVRIGISYEMEVDFLGTPKGRMVLMKTIDQFARSRQATLEAEVIRALCTGHRYQQEFVRQNGQPQDQQLKYFLKQDRDRFAISQKSKNGLEKLDAMINKEMQAYGGYADAYLLPEEIAVYQSLGPAEKTDYYLAGQAGPDRVNGGAITGPRAAAGTQGTLQRVEPVRMINNVATYVIKNARLEGMTEEETQYLRRVRQIGEYFAMLDECGDYSNYHTKHRSILVYNEDIDELSKIELEHAIEHCGLWDENTGDVKPLQRDPKMGQADLRDADQDCFTYLVQDGRNTRRATCEYLFDMAPEFLSTKAILNGAESIRAQLLRQYGNSAKDALDGWNALNSGVLEDYDSLNNAQKTIVDNLGKWLVGILGKTWFPAATLAGRVNPGAFFYEFIVLGGFEQEERFDDNLGTDETINAKLRQVDEAFVQLVQSQVPAGKRAETAYILQSDRSALEKGEQIRSKLAEYVEQGVAGLKLKSVEHLNDFYNERVKQYKDKTAEFTSTSSRSSGSRGYRRASFDSDPLMTIPGIAKMIMRQNNLDEPVNNRISEIGAGLSSIGQFASSNNRERAARNADFNGMRNRLATLAVQLNNLNSSGAGPVLYGLGLAYLMSRLNKQTLLSFCRNNIAVPLNFLLFRPHMQYTTRGIVKVATGGKCGYLFVGNQNFMIASTADVKKVKMHLTMHMRAVVVQAKNLYVQPDVHVQEYNGGSGIRFWDENSYLNYDPDNLEHSLFCIAVPVTEVNFPSPMDTAGRFYTEFTQGNTSRAVFERLHYSTAYRYNQLYKFLQVSREGSTIPGMTRGREHRNRVIWQGHQQGYNPISGSYDYYRVGQGHFGKEIYPGVGRIRAGAIETFEKQNFSTRNMR